MSYSSVAFELPVGISELDGGCCFADFAFSWQGTKSFFWEKKNGWHALPLTEHEPFRIQAFSAGVVIQERETNRLRFWQENQTIWRWTAPVPDKYDGSLVFANDDWLVIFGNFPSVHYHLFRHNSDGPEYVQSVRNPELEYSAFDPTVWSAPDDKGLYIFHELHLFYLPFDTSPQKSELRSLKATPNWGGYSSFETPYKTVTNKLIFGTYNGTAWIVDPFSGEINSAGLPRIDGADILWDAYLDSNIDLLEGQLTLLNNLPDLNEIKPWSLLGMISTGANSGVLLTKEGIFAPEPDELQPIKLSEPISRLGLGANDIVFWGGAIHPEAYFSTIVDQFCTDSWRLAGEALGRQYGARAFGKIFNELRSRNLFIDRSENIENLCWRYGTEARMEILTGLEDPHPAVLSAALMACHVQREDTRDNIAFTIDEIPENPRPFLLWDDEHQPPSNRIRALLDHQDERVKKQAILCAVNLRLPEIVPRISGFIDSANPKIRCFCAKALSLLDEATESEWQKLKALLAEDPYEEVREEAVNALARIEYGRKDLSWLIAAMTDNSTRVLQAASHSLVAVHSSLTQDQMLGIVDGLNLQALGKLWDDDFSCAPWETLEHFITVVGQDASDGDDFDPARDFEERDCQILVPIIVTDLFYRQCFSQEDHSYIQEEELDNIAKVLTRGTDKELLDVADIRTLVGDVIPKVELARLALKVTSVLPDLGARLQLLITAVSSQHVQGQANTTSHVDSENTYLPLHQRLQRLSRWTSPLDQCRQCVSEKAEESSLLGLTAQLVRAMQKLPHAEAKFDESLTSGLARNFPLLLSIYIKRLQPVDGGRLMSGILANPATFSLARRISFFNEWFGGIYGPLDDATLVTFFREFLNFPQVPFDQKSSVADRLIEQKQPEPVKTFWNGISETEIDQHHLHFERAFALVRCGEDELFPVMKAHLPNLYPSFALVDIFQKLGTPEDIDYLQLLKGEYPPLRKQIEEAISTIRSRHSVLGEKA